MHAKMQWLQYPNKVNAYNLENIRCEARRHFKRSKLKISKLDTKNKKRNSGFYRDINDFRKGYEPM